MPTTRTGGQILVDHLVSEGVDRVFCVPGESYLAVLDALHDTDIEIVVCRQEGGAAMMAEAYGKLTGRPGICLVTRGPGATNASAGIHIAQQDAPPMILFVGQVERGFIGREAFQEVDYRAAFSPIAKWATEIEDTGRVGEIVSRAFHTARSGRPGPVVIALPEDILTETSDAPAVPPASEAMAWPAPRQIERLSTLLAESKLPVAIIGGSRWSAEAVAYFTKIAESFDLPVAVTSPRQMLFNADHANFVGDLGVGPNPALLDLIGKSDLILLVGDRLSETPSQSYTLIKPDDDRKLVHVFPEANELGRFYRPTLSIACSPTEFAQAVSELRPGTDHAWSQITKDARAAYAAYSDPSAVRIPGEVQMGEIMAFLRERVPSNAIICNGAGNYTAWVHRFYRFREYGTQLAPVSGSMGYGVPAAVSAKISNPDRMVIAFAGDGCFLMHGQEFATAVQHNAPVIVILVDNSMYGTIRMHQERDYPGRVTATKLKNPDFAAYARAFGGHGETVRSTSEFAEAFERAVASGLPSILHCIIDPEAITPTITLAQIRERAQAPKSTT